MISKRHGLTLFYSIIVLGFFISEFVFMKKTTGMDIQTKRTFIIVSIILILVVISSLFTYDLFLEDDYLILKSDIKSKKFLIKELKVNNVQVYCQPTFTLSLNNQNFSVNYTVENFNALEFVVKNCKESNVSEQDLKKIENRLIHPF